MELDFTDELLEKLIVKKALVDVKWNNTLSKVFDKRWFSNINLKIILALQLNYYKQS